MRRLICAFLLLALPAFAQMPDLAGSWTGTITTVGTRLQSTYSPITGVTVTPVPDVKISPSPFGPLELASDGSWAMPVLDISGEWSLDGTTLNLSGGLAGSSAHVEMLDTGPVVVIDMAIGGGQMQTVTFSRMP